MSLEPIILAELQRGGPPLWVSGRTYPKGWEVRSPANLQRYVRKVAGAGATDPSADTGNWELWSKTVDATLETLAQSVASISATLATVKAGADALGAVSGVLVIAQPVLISKSYTVAKDGYAVLTGMGGGAGAPMAYMPGNSAPWGVKVISVKAGDVITFSIGAGGAPGTYSGSSATWTGKQGGTTTISLNGSVIMTCQGGEEGPQSTSVPSPVNAMVIGADYWTKGLQPKTSLGGAAVDLGFGSISLGAAYGDVSAVAGSASMGSDNFAPLGYHFYPFDFSVIAQSNLQPGYAGSNYFAGGVPVQAGPSPTSRPGRGGSGGSSGNQNNVPSGAAGGNGMGYIRLFAKP